jgi:hypothetical protein
MITVTYIGKKTLKGYCLASFGMVIGIAKKEPGTCRALLFLSLSLWAYRFTKFKGWEERTLSLLRLRGCASKWPATR